MCIPSFDRKTSRREPLGRPRSICKNNIEKDLREIEKECVNWIHMAKDKDQWCAFVNRVMNLQVPGNVGNFLTR
jgi:hypothetical protein